MSEELTWKQKLGAKARAAGRLGLKVGAGALAIGGAVLGVKHAIQGAAPEGVGSAVAGAVKERAVDVAEAAGGQPMIDYMAGQAQGAARGAARGGIRGALPGGGGAVAGARRGAMAGGGQAAVGMAAAVRAQPGKGKEILEGVQAHGRVKPKDPRAYPAPKPGLIGASASQIAKAACEAGCHKGGGRGIRHPQQAAKRKLCLKKCR